MKSKYPAENQKLGEYYDRLLATYGPNHRALGWFDPETQRKRFLVAEMMGDFTGASVLDVGCGFGSFYQYLTENKLAIKAYTGLDVSPQMIKEAQLKSPEAAFICGDVFTTEFKEKFDYVVACGVFNNRMPQQEVYLQQVLTKMFALTKKGLAVSMLSSLTPEKLKFKDTLYYYEAPRVLAACFRITRYVELRHNYLPNDFTIYLYR